MKTSDRLLLAIAFALLAFATWPAHAFEGDYGPHNYGNNWLGDPPGAVSPNTGATYPRWVPPALRQWPPFLSDIEPPAPRVPRQYYCAVACDASVPGNEIAKEMNPNKKNRKCLGFCSIYKARCENWRENANNRDTYSPDRQCWILDR